MKNSIWISAGFLLILACSSPEQNKQVGPISQVQLKNHIEYLASSELAGRKANERGFILAVEYVTNYCREIGLEGFFPFSQDRHNKGNLLQKVPFLDYHYGPDNWLSFKDDKKFHIEDNYFLLNSGKTIGLISIDSILFVGFGIHEPDLGWNDFKGIDLEGKFVMIVDGLPDKNDFPEIEHLYSESHISLKRKIDYLHRYKAAGLIIVSESSRKSWDLTKRIHQKLGYKPIDLSFWADPYHPELPVVMIHPDIFNHYFPGIETNTSKNNYPSPYVVHSEIKLSVDVKNRVFDSPNVAGIIQGTDSLLVSEFIVLGAHLDHIGTDGKKIFYGANDNASSCAALLELARNLKNQPCKRSVVFVFYTAEEPCLWGSQYFVSNFPGDKKQILVNINVEMIGKAKKGNVGTIAIGPEEFKSYFHKIDPLSVNYLDLENYKDKYSGSDQLSYYRNGIPAIRFGNLDYPEKHTTKDDVSIIDFNYLEDITETLFNIVNQIANE